MPFGRMRGRGMRGRYFQQGRGMNINPQGDKPGSGPSGNCICPKCGYTTPHSRLQPCNQRKCPKCGNIMTRQ